MTGWQLETLLETDLSRWFLTLVQQHTMGVLSALYAFLFKFKLRYIARVNVNVNCSGGINAKEFWVGRGWIGEIFVIGLSSASGGQRM